MRRGNSGGTPVSYASVGMTQKPDIIAFPPEGFAGVESSWRIGSGTARYTQAQDALFTWGLQRAAHLEVDVLEEGDTTGYQGLEFDSFGIARREVEAGPEVSYSSDGTAFIQPGTVVRLSGLWTPVEDTRDFRVIYVMRESRRCGFALGTLEEIPVSGEEFFGLEWRPDDSVWAIVRSVTSVPPSRWRWALLPLIRLRQSMQLRANVRALSPARQG